MVKMYNLGIDLGGTNIAAAVVDENYKIVGSASDKTGCPAPAEMIADNMCRVALAAVKNAGLKIDDINEVGVGSPGSVNPEKGEICYSANLGFANTKLGKMLEDRLGKRVFLENDANAAAYGEMIAGAGKGTKDFIAITLGTGVGGGVIMDGKMLTGSNFAGGELGHIVIVKDGAHCSCGRDGCWEAYASATGLIRETREAMQKDKQSKMWEIACGSLDNVNGRTAFQGKKSGDETAKRVVKEYCDYVACGLTNIINIFQPDMVCIGGGISKEGEILAAPVREYVERERFSKNVDKQTIIKTAQLGNNAGIIGAAFIGDLYR